MSQGGHVLGGKCPGGKCPGGKCPEGICPWGKCPGGTCPGGLCPRTTEYIRHLGIGLLLSHHRYGLPRLPQPRYGNPSLKMCLCFGFIL